MARIIESPGVQISEIDLSLKSSLPTGTNILVNGFTDQGPTQELLNVTSIQEYEQIYGVPSNAAERYSYHTMKNLLSTPAKVVFNRLPYGDEGGSGFNNKYTAMLYPLYSTTAGGEAVSAVVSGDTLYVGRPTQITITEATYNTWKQGGITWDGNTMPHASSSSDLVDPAKQGFIVVNKLQTSVNQDFEGYYVGLSDNSQSTATDVSGDFEFSSLTKVYTSKDANLGVTSAADWAELADSRLGFPLTGNASDVPDSISETVEAIPTWDFGSADYNDGIILGLYKFRRSAYNQNQNALSFVQYESFAFSLGAERQYTQPDGFQETSFFAENIVNNDSTFLEVLVNEEVSKQNWMSDAGLPTVRFKVLTPELSTTLSIDDQDANAAFTLGLYQDKVTDTKLIGDIPSKLTTGLRLAEDWEVLPLDIVLDGGLSTIHSTMKVPTVSGNGEFVDTKNVPFTAYEDSSADASQAWLTVYNQFDIFCRDVRKDCMFIADVYRNILINGKDFKTLDDKTKNFSQHVYTPLKELTSACNSSYSAIYAQWAKVYDTQSKDYAWIPYSGFQGSIMSRLDSVLYPWSAPAGLENGLVVGALDIALSTTQKHRDLLYRNNINPVVFFPSDGITCWGQKTLQKKPSAFDRINVRRLFLTLEKSTRGLMKYFVFQPNTTFTRTRVVNVLNPIFDIAKNNEGVYDFLIVCDERNNTPTVIDNNELQVDIYLKPVRTAEFVLVNFYATRTDQDFNELI